MPSLVKIIWKIYDIAEKQVKYINFSHLDVSTYDYFKTKYGLQKIADEKCR